MKTLLAIITILSFTSCADLTQMSYRNKYERQTTSKFLKKRNYIKGQARYVPTKRDGCLTHPAVTINTFRQLKSIK